MTTTRKPLQQSAEEFIQETAGHCPAAKGWGPPPHLIPELDKILKHNREHPERRIGSIKVTQWLKRNGVVVSKDAVYRWLKNRSLE